MIRFIIGRPGGGKSMLATKKVLEELENTERNIATNLPLNLAEIASYLHEKKGSSRNVLGRVRILTPTECVDFWNHPVKYLDLTGRMKLTEGAREMTRPDFEPRKGHGGTLFLIDEVHEFFNARKWQNTGEDALYYLAQHRRLGDDVYLITQALGNVDKQLRSVAQDFISVRNLSVERWGLFKLPGWILIQTYLNPPTGNEKPMTTEKMQIDVKVIGKMYDTASGVGISGHGADVGKNRAKGIPIWIPVVLLFALVFGVAFAPKFFVDGFLTKKVAESVVEKEREQEQPKQPASDAVHPTETNREPLRVVGTYSEGKTLRYWLNNGETVDTRDPQFKNTVEGMEWKGRKVQPVERVTPELEQQKERQQPVPLLANPQSVFANPEAGTVRRSRAIRIRGFNGESWAVRREIFPAAGFEDIGVWNTIEGERSVNVGVENADPQ